MGRHGQKPDKKEVLVVQEIDTANELRDLA